MVTAATPLVRASSLTGRPVVTKEGTASGEVQDLVLDGDGRTIGGLTLRAPGVFGRRHIAVVPIASVTAIGPDAVIIAADPDAPPDERDPAVCADVIGSPVVTEAGVEIGTISDVVIETRRSRVRVEAVELGTADGTRYLVLDDAAGLAGDVVVVPRGSEGRLHETPEQVADHIAKSRR